MPEEDIVVIVADDPASVEADLAAGRLVCPRCGGVLGGWGRARRRELLTRVGVRWLRPRRARCRDRGCAATHVLLPDVCLTRRQHSVELIGEALRASAQAGYRTAADALGLSAETVRGWRARFRSRSELVTTHFWRWARALDGALRAPGVLRGSVADALEAIGVCARAASLALGRRPPWSWVSALTAGGLLGSINTSAPWPVPE